MYDQNDGIKNEDLVLSFPHIMYTMMFTILHKIYNMVYPIFALNLVLIADFLFRTAKFNL